MARLPSEKFLVQKIENYVIVYEDGTEFEIVRFDATDSNATARAQKAIHDSSRMSAEDKCFAHFWCGYFHAYAQSFRGYCLTN